MKRLPGRIEPSVTGLKFRLLCLQFCKLLFEPSGRFALGLQFLYPRFCVVDYRLGIWQIWQKESKKESMALSPDSPND